MHHKNRTPLFWYLLELSFLPFFYYVKEGGDIIGHVVSRNYKVSLITLITAGSLEISLWLTFSGEQRGIHEMAEDVVGYLYNYNHYAQNANNYQTIDDSDTKMVISVEWGNFLLHVF